MEKALEDVLYREIHILPKISDWISAITGADDRKKTLYRVVMLDDDHPNKDESRVDIFMRINHDDINKRPNNEDEEAGDFKSQDRHGSIMSPSWNPYENDN